MHFTKENTASPWSPFLCVLPPPLYTPVHPTMVRCWLSPVARARARDVMWCLAHAMKAPNVSPRLHTQQVGPRRLPLIRAPGTGGRTQRDGTIRDGDSPGLCPSGGWYEKPGWRGLPLQPWPCPRESKVTLGVIKEKVPTCRLEDIT